MEKRCKIDPIVVKILFVRLFWRTKRLKRIAGQLMWKVVAYSPNSEKW